MNKILILIGLFTLASCDSTSGPGNGGTPVVLASTYFPYQVGDSMTYEIQGFLENDVPFTDTFVRRVIGTQLIDGTSYQLHVDRAFKMTFYPDSVYWRIEGSKAYKRVMMAEATNKDEYVYLDFSGDTTELIYVPLRKEKDTTFVTVPAGRFTLAVKMKSGSFANFSEIYAPGVGMLTQNLGREAAITRLISARVGGRSYP